MSEAPPIHWKRGDPAPRGWHLPRFAREDGSAVGLVEAFNDTAMKEELGYPVGPLVAIPDGFAKTDDGRWVVWEEKGRDNVQKALHQLEEGVRNLLSLGRSVDHLGITLDRFDGAERWKCNSLGYLMPKAQVHATPYEVCGRKVWVEQRGR